MKVHIKNIKDYMAKNTSDDLFIKTLTLRLIQLMVFLELFILLSIVLK